MRIDIKFVLLLNKITLDSDPILTSFDFGLLDLSAAKTLNFCYFYYYYQKL